MRTRLFQAIFFLFLMGCYPKAVETERRVVETETPVEEDSTGTVTDTAEEEEEEEEEEEVEPDTGPIGVWSTCNGKLTRDAETFLWEGNLYPCNISGSSSFEDGILTLNADNFENCEVLPWWFDIFEDESPSFVTAVNGSRLTFLPTIPTDSARVLNLEETLEIEEWAMEDEAGNTSGFKLCWLPTGQFFEGRYMTMSDSCEFISCGGVINQVIDGSDDEQHWVAQCAGNCPCGGIVTIEERTEETLSGRYHASNCARLLEGNFTATPKE